jgi:Uncharacterized conserved protein (DUF2075)
MPALYRDSLGQFVAADADALVGVLAQKSASQNAGVITHLQIGAWASQVRDLQKGLRQLSETEPRSAEWVILLEYSIPVIGRRPDAVLLGDGHIFVIEYKAGTTESADSAFNQALGYALDLRDFHERSRERQVIPIALGTMKGGARYHDDHGGVVRADELAAKILATIRSLGVAGPPLSAEEWDNSRYFAVPTLVEAAAAIFDDHDVREISHSRAGSDNLASTIAAILSAAAEAKQTRSKLLCLVTGVPGAGKTLAGLHAISQLVKTLDLEEDQAAFLSGNSPLVNVLRKALGASLTKMRGLRVTSRALESSIQEMHRFVRDSYELSLPPAHRAIVFDEAQRAWSRERNKAKFGRDISEPEMILQIMSRHEGWALIVGLIGGGQEIHSGEAGLSAWGEALLVHSEWRVISSPQAINGGDLVAGSTLFAKDSQINSSRITISEDLHLGVSKRSYDAENNARWVNAVLEGRITEASVLSGEHPAVFLTRSLDAARAWLKQRIAPNRRSGLVASSSAARLRGDSVETPTFKFLSGIDYPAWFLKPDGDVRSSNQLEVAMSEFELQGLELDNVCLLWGGDLIFVDSKPVTRKFRGSTWTAAHAAPKDESDDEDPDECISHGEIDRHTLTLNKYRVLMTRYRKSMVIFVPKGSETDITRSPGEFNAVADYLIRCGARPLDL